MDILLIPCAVLLMVAICVFAHQWGFGCGINVMEERLKEAIKEGRTELFWSKHFDGVGARKPGSEKEEQ